MYCNEILICSSKMLHRNMYIVEQMFTKSVPSTLKMKVKGGAAVDPDSGKKKYRKEKIFYY